MICFDSFILDYVSGGELFTHLYNREYFAEEEAKFYTAEVALALDFLHKVLVVSFCCCCFCLLVAFDIISFNLLWLLGSLFVIFLLVFLFYSRIIVSAWVLVSSSKPQPRNFFCSQGTKELSRSPRQTKVLIIPICYSCLTITLMLSQNHLQTHLSF